MNTQCTKYTNIQQARNNRMKIRRSKSSNTGTTDPGPHTGCFYLLIYLFLETMFRFKNTGLKGAAYFWTSLPLSSLSWWFIFSPPLPFLSSGFTYSINHQRLTQATQTFEGHTGSVWTGHAGLACPSGHLRTFFCALQRIQTLKCSPAYKTSSLFTQP